ncbi:twin-arginine translocase TatA/TatE family subunit [Streptomyces sp. HSG2]|nr:twin-arginine translocase TatA/TatE family subunit [Streptomyces sp. HSG2]
MLGLSELAIILIVLIAFLTIRKLPELTRSAGKAARILKAERRAMKEAEPTGRAGDADSGTAEPGDARRPTVIEGETVRRPDDPA